MKNKVTGILLRVICGVLVMALAVLVRMPAAWLPGVPAEIRSDFTDDAGLVYFMEMDSYYHTRLTDNYIKYGTMADSISEEGKPWDSRRHYPGGRSAEYQPGIVWIAASLWRVMHALNGTNLYTIEFYLPVLMAALSGLVVFLFVTGISNIAGGFTAGVLVSCGTAFVERTIPGRFDTDMFVVLMDVLLIAAFTEMLKAESWNYHSQQKRTLGNCCLTVLKIPKSYCPMKSIN